jgi:hypothetical protein
MSTSTQLTPSELLPPPPQTVAGGPSAGERANMDSEQFKHLLNLVGGKRSRRRRRKSTKRRSRKSRKTCRSRRSRLYRRKKGGNSLPVNVPPVPYNDTSYPPVSKITTDLAAITAQSNADSRLDAVGGNVVK